MGIKPTVGLTSRAGVVPESLNQDTVGCLAKTVKEATYCLDAIYGPDQRDNDSLAQGQVRGPNEPVPDTGLGEKKDALVDAKNQYVGAKEEVKSQAKGHAQDVADSARQQHELKKHNQYWKDKPIFEKTKRDRRQKITASEKSAHYD